MRILKDHDCCSNLGWLQNLILNVGNEQFGNHLVRVLHEVVGAHDCAAFSYASSGVKTLTIGSMRDVSNTKVAADRYEREFWKKDKFLLNHQVAACQNGTPIYSIAVEEIDDPMFRQRCYDYHDIATQISFRIRRDSEIFALSAFRERRSGNASPDDIRRLAVIAGTLMSLVVRHSEIIRPFANKLSKPMTLSNAERLVSELENGLTQRERSVCSRLLRGLTVQGIALELGLSTHSVVTYKRRAFHKLNIATTVELFSFFMRSAEVSLSKTN